MESRVEPAHLGWCAGGVEIAHNGAVVDREEAELYNVAHRSRDYVGGEDATADGDGDFCGCDGGRQGGEQGECYDHG